jgi:OmcA/MtrC family decaheme c-type cytochrome
MTMSATLRRLVLLAVIISLVAVPVFARGRAVAKPSDPTQPARQWVYESNQLEFYLDDAGIAYIRPGVKVKVASITNVEGGKKPVVEVYITDDFDQPLDRAGKITPGAVGLSFIFAWYNPETRQYVSYYTRTAKTPQNSPRPGATGIQAGTAAGTWTDLEMGHAKFTFNTALPATIDTTKTHTLGIYGTRNLVDILNKTYYINLEHDFRPDSQAVTETWDKTFDAASCNNCHNPLSAHGGSRRDVKLCAMCHTPQTVDPDTGLTMDFKVLVHKIHAPGLLEEPYVIWGHNQSIHDYSEVTFPQDVRNCQNCHEGTNAAKKPAQANVWYTNPSRAACGSCHDEVNFETGEGHSANNLAQADDTLCSTCHVPDSGEEFDASIKGAHVIPEKSSQLEGLNVAIVNIANGEPGKTPTVTFKITNGDGTAVDGSKLSTFAPMLAGPTSSYSAYYREAAPARAVFDEATGNTIFTFNAKIPDDATGTWTISGDFYRNSTIKRATGGDDISVREAAVNPFKSFNVNGGAVTPRRTVVSMALCNACHDRLALHGGQRLAIEECVICHNPTNTDVSRRPADAGAPESISFQYMIHRIHSGHELERDFTVYGFGGSAHHYNEVTFPGDRRDCAACHVNNSHIPPVGGDAVTTPRDYFTPMGSGTAGCLGCHDSRDAAAHAYLNTTTFAGQPAESCGTCHGANATWSAAKVHAR